MDKRTLAIEKNVKSYIHYFQSLALVIILLGTNTTAIANTDKKAFKFENIRSQIIDLAPTEVDVPKSLKEQLRKQYKIVWLKKASRRYSTGNAEIEIVQPEKGHEDYVNFDPTNMYFSAHKIDLNNDYKPELEVTYNGFEASAINWPLWIFSIEGENYIPILKATVGESGYATLQSVSNGYHDILTTKTILDNPNEKAKNEFIIYKYNGSKYVINSKFIELSSKDNRSL